RQGSDVPRFLRQNISVPPTAASAATRAEAFGRLVSGSTLGTAPFAFRFANRLPTFQTAQPNTALRLFTIPIGAPFGLREATTPRKGKRRLGKAAFPGRNSPWGPRAAWPQGVGRGHVLRIRMPRPRETCAKALTCAKGSAEGRPKVRARSSAEGRHFSQKPYACAAARLLLGM